MVDQVGFLQNLTTHLEHYLLPEPKGFGHPRTVDLREILNAIFYVQRTGLSMRCRLNIAPALREKGKQITMAQFSTTNKCLSSHKKSR